jgi:phosphoribosylformylglycinamidine (FGAM) synthase PurS component
MGSSEVASSGLEGWHDLRDCRKAALLFHIEVSVKASFPDPEGDRLEKDIRDIGITTLTRARVSDPYLLEGQLNKEDVAEIGWELLADLVVEDFTWGEGPLSRIDGEDVHAIEVAYNLGWVCLHASKSSPCIFTRELDVMYIPVAHGEGNVVIEPGALGEVNVALHYADETGDIRAGYTYNPDGSMNNIGGVCDATGRIIALMPHPERFIRWTQHPRWTTEPRREYGDGSAFF